MKTVFEGPVFRIESGIVREPGGVRARRDIIRHSGSVAILPIDEDGRITLVRQYRCVFGVPLVELPAGRIDRGETARAAARRELREEIGMDARRYERLIRIVPSPGFLDETVTIYRASALFASAAPPDEDERIGIVRLTLAEALRRVRRGSIEDAKTVTALLLEAGRRG